MLTALLTGLLTCMAIIVAIGPQSAWLLRQGLRRDHVLVAVLCCLLGDALLLSLGTAGVGVVLDYAPWLLDVLRWGGVAYLLWFAFTSFRSAFRPNRDTSTIDVTEEVTAREANTGSLVRVQMDSDGAATSGPMAGIGADNGMGAGAGTDTATIPVVRVETTTQTQLVQQSQARQHAQAVQQSPSAKPAKNASKISTVIATGLTFSIVNPHAWVDSLVLLGSMANSFGDLRWIFAAGAFIACILWHSVLAGGAAAMSGLLNRPRVWQIIDVVVGLTMVVVAGFLAFNGLGG